MPNPNLSQLRLIKRYGVGPVTNDDTQTPVIYDAVSENSDQVDHKYVTSPLEGILVELSHYTRVKQVVLQNVSTPAGRYIYVDATTGALVPGFVLPGQEVSFDDPNVTTGILLYALAAADEPYWHIAIFGNRDPNWSYGDGGNGGGGGDGGVVLDCQDPEACWWLFRGPTFGDMVYLPKADGSIADFRPALNSNDFSIAGVIDPGTIDFLDARRRGVLVKSGTWYGTTEWALAQRREQMWFWVVGGGWSTGRQIGTLVPGSPNFVGGVYEYSGAPGNTSYMKVWCNANTLDRFDAGGPIVQLAGNGPDVVIGSWDYAWGSGLPINIEDFWGDIYWLAYYNKRLSDAEMESLRDGTAHPRDITNLYMYICFCRDVEATYVPESCIGPNAPYTFQVGGTPIKFP